MAEYTDVRNPAALADGRVNCEILHRVYGWMPFTASAEDPEADGRDLHAALLAGTYGAVTPYVAPTPAEVAAAALAAERAAMRPFYTAFRLAMKATPSAGYAHLLDRVTQTVSAARAQDPFADIVIWWDSVTQIVRTHPDMDVFAVMFSLTPEALDDLCRLALQKEAGT